MPKRMQHLVGCQEMEIKMPSICVSTTLVWSAVKVDFTPSDLSTVFVLY